MTLNNFLEVAWQSQICISNWPSTEFPKFNTSDQKHMAMVSTWAVLEPWWCDLQREYNVHAGLDSSNEVGRLKGSIYELNWWDDGILFPFILFDFG